MDPAASARRANTTLMARAATGVVSSASSSTPSSARQQHASRAEIGTRRRRHHLRLGDGFGIFMGMFRQDLLQDLEEGWVLAERVWCRRQFVRRADG